MAITRDNVLAVADFVGTNSYCLHLVHCSPC